MMIGGIQLGGAPWRVRAAWIHLDLTMPCVFHASNRCKRNFSGHMIGQNRRALSATARRTYAACAAASSHVSTCGAVAIDLTPTRPGRVSQ